MRRAAVAPILLIVVGLGSALIGVTWREVFQSGALNAATGNVASAEELQRLGQRLKDLEQEISDARRQAAGYTGGLIKTLVDARIEILATNAALVRQRRDAILSGARTTITVVASTTDAKRVAELEKEIAKTKEQIASQARESAQYTGGLVKVMLDSSIATNQVSLAMLDLERMKAQFGIHWVPKVSPGTSPQSTSALPATESAPQSDPPTPTQAEILKPLISNKKFIESNWKAGTYEDAIIFDVAWGTDQLPKPTRAVKGVLVFSDLFGEPKYRVRITLDDPIKPGAAFRQNGIGVKYNQFSDQDRWLRTTELKNMTIRFEHTDVLYADGTTARLER